MRLVSILSLLLTITNSYIMDCSYGNSLLKLTHISFLPDPLVAGENSSLFISMNVSKQINGGSATYGITYNFIPIPPVVENLCETVDCPVMPGRLSTKLIYPISPSLSGSVQIKVTWKDNSSNHLLCVSVRTKVGLAAKQLIPYSNKSVLPQPMCPLYKNSTYNSALKYHSKKSTKKNRTNSTLNPYTSKLRGKV